MPPADAPLDLTRARQLASAGEAVAIPHDLARTIAAELGRACDEVERLRVALAEARVTITRLNRRAQQAEAIADRYVAGRPVTGPGLGRALANYAAARLAAIAEAALDGWDRAVSLRPDTPEEREWLTWALAVLTGRENGEGRATVGGMASPHSPPPTKDLSSLLAEIETAAQEAMRLHPHALHLRSVLALCDVTRRENACEEPDPSPAPPR